MSKSTSNSTNIIQIRDLEVEFRTDEGTIHAVKKISFDIPRGTTVGLVGESGSGKSVTSLAIMRLIPNPPGKIAGGQIILCARDNQRDLFLEIRRVENDAVK